LIFYKGKEDEAFHNYHLVKNGLSNGIAINFLPWYAGLHIAVLIAPPFTRSISLRRTMTI